MLLNPCAHPIRSKTITPEPCASPSSVQADEANGLSPCLSTATPQANTFARVNPAKTSNPSALGQMFLAARAISQRQTPLHQPYNILEQVHWDITQTLLALFLISAEQEDAKKNRVPTRSPSTPAYGEYDVSCEHEDLIFQNMWDTYIDMQGD